MTTVPQISAEQLRLLVRSVLREVMPNLTREAAPVVEIATVQNDSDLMQLVRRVVQLLDDPSKASAIRSGDYKFKLNVGATPFAHTGATEPVKLKSTIEVKEGLITEKKMLDFVGKVSHLVLGSKVVLTPGARDRARQAGIAIERSKS